ncbi:MAG: aspartate dehydrogenase [Lachnospiraceae bacterium]|jgi:hypothetical protein|nr:aspartate dehydrogenase [Lachnospiraceae bacterium]MBQ3968502.1 aspartate dehydrogenase [Lachnospiraceae bacterium]MBR4588532.1 aspartate dehydrogenase [Lachnospiraceae bacterium]MCR4926450.1 aspartate dehydrogenase [Lachnospiraceae bacterium]
MFGRKKKKEIVNFDRENLRPVIRCSICTGEQVAGFIDKRDGRFKEVMLIRTEADKEEFLEMYGLSDVEKIY